MPPRRIQFGAFELEPEAGELRKHGIKIKLQEQPLQILQQLLEHPGEVVTREELQKRIWPADTFVDFDHGLYSAVQRLRDALGDTAETPRYVETLPRRGYRFIALVNHGNRGEAEAKRASVEAPASAVPGRPAPRRSLQMPMLVAAGVILVALLVALAFMGGSLRERLVGKPAVPPIHSIAVLPLQNLSNDPSQEYFADGMTDALITDLAQIGSLKVISRTSTMHYKKSDKTLPEIARELNVDGIVEGTVQRSGNRVRVTAQLIYAPKDQHLWAGTYERDLRDVFAMQSEVALAIADEIRVKMTAEEKASLKPAQPVNPKVLEAFWEGTYHFDQAWDATWRKQRGKKESDEEYSKAISSLDEVIREDPDYVPAYLALARQILVDMPRVDLAPRAKVGLTKVLALDEADLTAHLLMAEYLACFDGNWDAAGKEYKRAVELRPDSAEAHDAYAKYLDDLGRFKEGMEEHQRAQVLDQHNDYLSSSPLTPLAIRLKRKREFTPTMPYDYWWRGNMEYEAGEYAEAFKDWQWAFRAFGWNEEADTFGRAYANGGPQAGAREMARILDEISKDRWLGRDVIIDSHFYAGDKEGTLGWLETAYEGRDQVIRHLKSDLRWDPYRSDPRFKEIVRRVGLPP
jgi:TolB-like protein/DNA-binding winged helix-turn-helix (wHTH) protein